jgi:hypothetical protein
MAGYATGELKQQRDGRIWERRREGALLREIAAEFGISYGLVAQITRNAPERTACANYETIVRKQMRILDFWEPPPKPPLREPRPEEWRTPEDEWHAIRAGV